MQLSYIPKKNKDLNNLTVMEIYDKLKMLALSVFKWDNLPETCNARFLEETLFTHGISIFAPYRTGDGLVKKGGIVNLKCVPAETKTLYEEYAGYHGQAFGYNEYYTANDCVVVHNNNITKSTDSIIWLSAIRLAEIQRSIDTNIKQQKFPMVLICTEKEKTTLKNMYDQFDSNSPCIYATTPTLMDSFKPLKTDAPFVADRLRTEYNNEWNKTLTQIGICTNPSTDKKERLITNEVDANNEETLTFAHSFLQMRQQACKELNARFKCNASVSMRLYSVDDEPTQTGTNTTEKDGED